ncbi:MAG: hypothetical protein JSW40_07250, partial [Candidatus Omnitrophota bacterium]
MKRLLVFIIVIGTIGTVAGMAGYEVFNYVTRDRSAVEERGQALPSQKMQPLEEKDVERVDLHKKEKLRDLKKIRKKAPPSRTPKAKRIFTKFINAVEEAKIIAEGVERIAELEREPSIMEALVEVEKARRKGFEAFETSKQEGILYEGHDFKVTEKTEDEGGSNIRTLALVTKTGSTLAEEKMIGDEVIVGLSSYEDAQALTSSGALSIVQAPPQGVGAYKLKIEDGKRVEEALALVLTEGNAIIKEQSLEENVGTIQFAEPNGIVGVNENIESLPNDPEFWSQWGLHNIGQTLPVGDEEYDVPKATPDVDIDAPESWNISKGEK